MSEKKDIKNGAKFKFKDRIGTAYAVTPESIAKGIVDLLFEGNGCVVSGENYAPPLGQYNINVLETI